MSTASLHQLSLSSLQGLAQACLHQRLTLPLTIADLTSYIPDGLLVDTFKSLNHLSTQGFSLSQIGLLLETIRSRTSGYPPQPSPPELVWTGPEVTGDVQQLKTPTQVTVQFVNLIRPHKDTWILSSNLLKEFSDRLCITWLPGQRSPSV
jgi:hypothetical protein